MERVFERESEVFERESDVSQRNSGSANVNLTKVEKMHDVPESIGPFKIVRKLGTNGWLETFEAFAKSPPHSRFVVRRLIPTMRDWPEGVEMFRRKVGKLARLCHPNIFTVDFHDPDAFFYATDFLKGQSLDEVLQSGSLGQETALSVTRDIGAALAHSHSHGILHGELSPACCFLTENCRGMLKNFNDFVAPKDVVMIPRNPIYLPPETIKGLEMDARADVYCLAGLLWQLLCGRSAYRYENQLEVLKQKMIAPPPSPRQENSAVPLYLDAVIRRAMATDPDRRFQNIADFLGAIETTPQDISRQDSVNGFGLAIVSGKGRGVLVPISNGNFPVGRSSGGSHSQGRRLDIPEEGAAIVQFKLVLEPGANRWFLQVCGTPPVKLNGVEYRHDSTALPPVTSGDVISFGQTDLIFLEL
jgi:serine/threonine protein kinase